MAQKHPAVRWEVIEGLAAMLDNGGDDDREALGYVVFVLCELKAREAWTRIERAFERGAVDLSVISSDDARFHLADAATA